MLRTSSTLTLVLVGLSACTVDYDISKIDPALQEAPELVDSDVPVDEVPEVIEAPPEDEVPEPEPEPELPDDPPPEDDCEDTSDLVYAISRDGNGLYLFDPVTVTFDYLGDLDCDMWGTPNSMGIARDGMAYVRWSDETLYQVDLQTLQCTPTSYGQQSSFGAFGMGFATESAGSWRDELFVANASSLARLNTQTWQLDPIGPLPSQSELTGNADGELWAFLPLEQPAALVRLSKTDGQPEEFMSLQGFPSAYEIDAFAFAHWGGDFWLFVRTYGVGSSSDVYRVDANGQMTVAARRVGFDIVGAGVSTCAPSQ